MKLFIWEGDGVLEDYSTGLICVIAEDLEEANNIILKEIGKYAKYPKNSPSEIIDLNDKINKNIWCVYGGG